MQNWKIVYEDDGRHGNNQCPLLWTHNRNPPPSFRRHEWSRSFCCCLRGEKTRFWRDTKPAYRGLITSGEERTYYSKARTYRGAHGGESSEKFAKAIGKDKITEQHCWSDSHCCPLLDRRNRWISAVNCYKPCCKGSFSHLSQVALCSNKNISYSIWEAEEGS